MLPLSPTTAVRGRMRVGAQRLWHTHLLRQLLVAVIDLILILALFLTLHLLDAVPPLDPSTLEPQAWSAVIALWIILLAACGSYSLAHLQTGASEYQRVGAATAFTAGALSITCYLADIELSRTYFVLVFSFGLPALLVGRFIRRQVLNRLRARGIMPSQVILAGSTRHVDDIAAVLRRERWLGYSVIGALTPEDIVETPRGIPVLGRVRDTADLVQDLDLYAVVFTEGAFPSSADFRRMAWELEQHSIEMIVVPALTDISAERITPRPVAGLPLVFVERPQAQQAGRWVKRLFDIVGSSILLLLAAPIVAITALAVKIEDRGPVFFRQVRVGRFGNEFTCLKIRSMCVNAEERLAELAARNEGAGVLFKMTRDPRITRVGQLIRRFSIDEIPQFWNVLRGDMSLVGPRPALPREVAQYDPDAARRLQVRPGLTGLWQVSGRSNLSWDDTVRLDLYYVDNWSVMQDLMILARTAKAVLGSSGAY